MIRSSARFSSVGRRCLSVLAESANTGNSKTSITKKRVGEVADDTAHRSTLPSAIENSNLFLSRIKSTTEFIQKLKVKAKADNLESKEKELDQRLSASDVWDDSKVATELSQELAAVRERLSAISTLELSLSDVTEMYDLALEESEGGQDNKEIIQDCFDALHKMEDEIERKEIESLMVGKYDKIDSCFLQINAGAGGTEACDWVGMIFRMYREFCKLNNYQLTIIDENINTEISSVGYRSITIRLKGEITVILFSCTACNIFAHSVDATVC